MKQLCAAFALVLLAASSACAIVADRSGAIEDKIDALTSKVDTVDGVADGIDTNVDSLGTTAPRLARVSWTFADYGGAQGAVVLFNVTGDVLLHRFFGVCRADLTGGVGATVAVGIAGNPDAVGGEVGAATFDENEIQDRSAAVSAEPYLGVTQTDPKFAYGVVTGGTDFLFTIANEDLTGGAVDYYVLWTPLSADGAVVAAAPPTTTTTTTTTTVP